MRKVSGLRLALLCGVVLAILRAAGGFALGLWARVNPEADMLALTDVPTMAVYAAMSCLGSEVEIVNAGDGRFLLVGTTVWFFLGLVGGGLMIWYRSRKQT